MQLTAAACAEHSLHAGFIAVEVIGGHQRLHAAGKAAAVDAPGALAREELGAQLQALLQLGVAGGTGDDVVQQLFRGASRILGTRSFSAKKCIARRIGRSAAE